jgi:hypothetical protein
MSTFHVLLICGGFALACYWPEMGEGIRKLARRRTRYAEMRDRGARPSQRAPRFFEEWSHTTARRFMTGNAARWDEHTEARVRARLKH